MGIVKNKILFLGFILGLLAGCGKAPDDTPTGYVAPAQSGVTATCACKTAATSGCGGTSASESGPYACGSPYKIPVKQANCDKLQAQVMAVCGGCQLAEHAACPDLYL